ncbi:MAG TPA: tetratricopeptide repeat protein [Oscillatoriaceae cyanobacterium M7585_C2015_266]|nr:tetratricopeptide repeat protein [Oscillatoriaceae cyanobacterium M7585_C2015_266]
MSILSELQARAAEYLQQQQYSEAIALYEQSIQENPKVMSNYWHLGLAYLLQGQESEAQVTWLSAMAQASPEQVNVWTEELIEVLEAEALRREAVSDFQIAWVIRKYIYEFAPEKFNNLLSIVWLSLQIEGFSLQQIKQEVSKFYIRLLDNKSNEFDREKTLQILKRFVYINPFHEIFDLFEEEKYSDFFVDNKKCWIEIKRELSDAYNNRGKILYQQGRFNEAAIHFQKAIELAEENENRELAVKISNMGMAIAKQGKYEEAVKYFQLAAEREPSLKEVNFYYIKWAKYEAENAKKGYQFTQDWFSMNIPLWESYLSKFANAADINFLEIGSWEGRATCWLLEKILTHPTARITCIDTFKGSLEHLQYDQTYLQTIEERFDFNIARTGGEKKVQKIVGRSQEVM